MQIRGTDEIRQFVSRERQVELAFEGDVFMIFAAGIGEKVLKGSVAYLLRLITPRLAGITPCSCKPISPEIRATLSAP